MKTTNSVLESIFLVGMYTSYFEFGSPFNLKKNIKLD